MRADCARVYVGAGRGHGERAFQPRGMTSAKASWAGALGRDLMMLAGGSLAGQGGLAHLALFFSCHLDAFVLNSPFVTVSL